MKYTDKNIRCVVNLEQVEYERALYYSFNKKDKFAIISTFKSKFGRNFCPSDESFIVEIVDNGKIVETEKFIFCHRMNILTKGGLLEEYFVFNNSAHTREAYEALRCEIELSKHVRDEHKFCSYNYQLLSKIPMWIRQIFKAV